MKFPFFCYLLPLHPNSHSLVFSSQSLLLPNSFIKLFELIKTGVMEKVVEREDLFKLLRVPCSFILTIFKAAALPCHRKLHNAPRPQCLEPNYWDIGASQGGHDQSQGA